MIDVHGSFHGSADMLCYWEETFDATPDSRFQDHPELPGYNSKSGGFCVLLGASAGRTQKYTKSPTFTVISTMMLVVCIFTALTTGEIVKSYSTLGLTVDNLFYVILGEFDYEELEQARTRAPQPKP